MSEACLHTHECELFGLLVARVVQDVYDWTGPFSHIFCRFFGGLSANTYIDIADWSIMFQIYMRRCQSSCM